MVLRETGHTYFITPAVPAPALALSLTRSMGIKSCEQSTSENNGMKGEYSYQRSHSHQPPAIRVGVSSIQYKALTFVRRGFPLKGLAGRFGGGGAAVALAAGVNDGNQGEIAWGSSGSVVIECVKRIMLRESCSE